MKLINPSALPPVIWLKFAHRASNVIILVDQISLDPDSPELHFCDIWRTIEYLAKQGIEWSADRLTWHPFTIPDCPSVSSVSPVMQ